MRRLGRRGRTWSVERVAPDPGPGRPARAAWWHRATRRGRSGRGSTTSPRCTRRWCSGRPTTCARTGSARCILALSGGIDSALIATIAADAIGPENVHVILMPTRWSSDHSVTDAEDLVEAAGGARADDRDPGDRGRVQDGLGEGFPATGLPAENLQSRVRGVINMARVQRRGAPGAHHRQQERDRDRLLDPVRRLGGRLRPDQGRAQDAGLGAVAVAQRIRRNGRG